MLGSTRRKFLAAAGAVVGLTGTVQGQELPPENDSNETSAAGATAQAEQHQEQEQKQPDGPHLTDAGAGVFPEGSGSIVEDVTRSSDGIRMTLLFPADQSEAPNHDQGSAMMPGGGRTENGNSGLLGGQNQERGRDQGQGQRGQQQGPGAGQTSDGASSGIMGFGDSESEAPRSGNETSTNGANTSRQ